jgi:hypothetical protein
MRRTQTPRVPLPTYPCRRAFVRPTARSDVRGYQLVQPNAQLVREVVESRNRTVDLAKFDRGDVRARVVRSAECRDAQALCATQLPNPASYCDSEVGARRARPASFGRAAFCACGHRPTLVRLGENTLRGLIACGPTSRMRASASSRPSRNAS